MRRQSPAVDWLPDGGANKARRGLVATERAGTRSRRSKAASVLETRNPVHGWHHEGLMSARPHGHTGLPAQVYGDGRLLQGGAAANTWKREKQASVVSMLFEAASNRNVGCVTGLRRDAIMRLMVPVEEKYGFTTDTVNP